MPTDNTLKYWQTCFGTDDWPATRSEALKAHDGDRLMVALSILSDVQELLANHIPAQGKAESHKEAIRKDINRAKSFIMEARDDFKATLEAAKAQSTESSEIDRGLAVLQERPPIKTMLVDHPSLLATDEAREEVICRYHEIIALMARLSIMSREAQCVLRTRVENSAKSHNLEDRRALALMSSIIGIYQED